MTVPFYLADHPVAAKLPWVLRFEEQLRHNHGQNAANLERRISVVDLWCAAHGRPCNSVLVSPAEALAWLYTQDAFLVEPSKTEEVTSLFGDGKSPKKK